MVGGSVALGPHYFLSERKREAFLAKKYGLKMDHYDHLFYIVNRQLDLPTMKSKKNDEVDGSLMSDTIKKMKIHFSEIMALVLPNHLEKKFYMKIFFCTSLWMERKCWASQVSSQLNNSQCGLKMEK